MIKKLYVPHLNYERETWEMSTLLVFDRYFRMFSNNIVSICTNCLFTWRIYD